MLNKFKKIKVSYVMNVLNGEPFIYYQLKSIYKFAHQIIIVEGAYKNYKHAANKFRSKDRTIKIIQNFPDPQKKIKLIIKNEYYKDRKEMCNEFMKFITGNVMWQVDVDEFYEDKTHRFVNKLFSKNEKLDQISFNFYNYYKTLDLVIDGYEESLIDVIRVNRVIDGMRWINQRPPTLVLKKKIILPRKKINGYEMKKNGHLMHNLPMLFDEQVKNKYIYHSARSRAFYRDFNKWYNESWKNYEKKFSIAGVKKSLTYLSTRKHKLPKILNKFSSDIKKKKVVNFEFESDLKIKKIISKNLYKKQKILANQINCINKESIFLKFFFFIFLISRIFIISPKKDMEIMLKVLIINLIPQRVKLLVNFFRL